MWRRSFLILAVFLLAMLLRVGWLRAFPSDPIAPVDAEGYHLIALNLRAGRGFSMVWDPPFCPTAIRAPLYPFFLASGYALLGPSPEHIIFFQVLLEVLTTALVMRLGREVGSLLCGRDSVLSLNISLLSGMLYALNGTTQRYTGVLFTEALLLPLVAAALWGTVVALKRRAVLPVILAGCFWGGALLTKPNVQFLVLSVAGLFLVRALGSLRGQGRCRTLLLLPWIFLGTVVLVVAPWLLRNRRVFGRWLLETAFEENLARVSAVATLAEVRDQRVAPWTPTWEMFYGELVEIAVQRYRWDARGEYALACEERDLRHSQVAAVAREVVAAHPGPFLAAHFKGVVRSLLDVGHRFWYPILTGRSWETTGVLDDIWRRAQESLRIGAVGDALHALWLERVVRPPLDAVLVWWGLLAARGLVWCLALRGIWRLRHAPWVALLLVGTVTYFIVLPGPIAYDRFYVPAVPAVVVLLASGVCKQGAHG